MSSLFLSTKMTSSRSWELGPEPRCSSHFDLLEWRLEGAAKAEVPWYTNDDAQVFAKKEIKQLFRLPNWWAFPFPIVAGT